MILKLTLAGVITLMVTQVAIAQVTMDDVLRLRNDKEVLISSFKEKERDKIIEMYKDRVYREKIAKVFYSAVHEYMNAENNQCVLQFIHFLTQQFANNKIESNKEAMLNHLKLLRVYNSIDDILYEMLAGNTNDYYGLRNVYITKKPHGSLFAHKKIIANNNVQDLYSSFSEFPDEIETCAYQEFVFIKGKILGKDGKKSKRPLKHMKFLNREALDQKIISLETYNKLEYLREESDISKRLIFFRDYMKIILRAKNQMVPITKTYKPITLEAEDKWSSERIERFSKLTRRKLLYRKYDETQIIILAQILQKASRRMGVDVDTKSGTPYLSQEFNVLQTNGERRTYVEKIDLDPQSQFNLARRLLRKDITDAQMMDTFNGLKITYTDVVIAAFETGYISIDDLQHVVRYDDLWDPTTSKWGRISGFIFKVAGYSTFFLPPPWNIVGTVAIGIVDGIVEKKFSTGDENDNPATFIE